MTRVLIVDDEKSFADATAKWIGNKGFDSATAGNLADARAALAKSTVDILLLDVQLPDGSGLELLEEIDPDARTRIVVMTGHPTVDVAIDSLRKRVADFLVKPVEPAKLLERLQALERALERSGPIEPKKDAGPAFEQFVGNSPAMLAVYRLIDRVATSNASVLVRGPSGTGKELVAEAVHARSERREKPFLSLNCGAVSRDLIGSQLFGHERGAFTGATGQHRGYFERADGGTLFLDEITEMPLALQVQLLRVLETGMVVRLGGDKSIEVDVRIIAATNRNPREAIAEGKFREDLYFRLAVFPIDMPRLDERAGDIPLIAAHFLSVLNKESATAKKFSAGAMRALEERTWPGNVRELKNAVHRAYILADEEISEQDLPPPEEEGAVAGAAGDGLSFSPGTPIEDVEKRLIFATLDKFGGDKTRTAELLGISVKTLYNRLNKYKAEMPEE